jgi:peptidoglycan/LPS O-acetylase OafA/YrhL
MAKSSFSRAAGLQEKVCPLAHDTALPAHQTVARLGLIGGVVLVAAYVTTCVWIVTLTVMLSPSSSTLVSHVESFFHSAMPTIRAHWLIKVMFPLTILSLALLETRRGTLGRGFSVIGDISYSMYLLHFPLQLLMALLVIELRVDKSIYSSTLVLRALFRDRDTTFSPQSLLF